MTAPESGIDEDLVIAKWQEISPLIERMVERIGQPNDFQVSPGSSLDADDCATGGYQLSHLIRMGITAGVDHLHAVKVLVVDGGSLHVAAPFSLSRAALETFAAAYWMLRPWSRTERVTRGLRWYAKNLSDQNTATSGLESVEQLTYEQKMRKVDAIADTHGISRSVVKKGYTSTAAVCCADNLSGVDVLFAWRLCSGFAHGRPWAYIGASERQEFATANDDVRFIRMTSTLGTALFPALQALHLLQALLTLHEVRGRPYWVGLDL